MIRPSQIPIAIGSARAWVAAALLAGVLLLQPGAIRAQHPSIASIEAIRFEGLTSRNEQRVLRRLSSKVGEPYNALSVREDLRVLARMMRKARVRTEPGEDGALKLIFDVEEYPSLRSVQVIGNEVLSTEKIEKIIGLKPGEPLQDHALGAIRRAILKEYDRRGLAEAKVSVTYAQSIEPTEVAAAGGELPHVESSADLRVMIDEGKKIQVDDVVIEGNEAFGNWRLKAKMATKGSFLFLKNYFDAEDFEEDLIALRRFYWAQGYFEAMVESGPFEQRKKGKKLIVTPVVRIHEGVKYDIGGVKIRGARLFDPVTLAEAFDEITGKPYSEKTFAEALRVVEQTYFEAGFLTTIVQPIYDFDSEPGKVLFTIEITEGNRIYVGEVGLKRPPYEFEEDEPSRIRRFYSRIAPPISDEAINREILLEPGQVYDKALERRSERNLHDMGVFSKVEIVNEPTADPRIHNVLISIEESATGQLFGGVGFGDASGAFVFAMIDERNLHGDARRLRIQAQIGSRSSNVNVSYQDRYYKDTEDTVTASVFYNRFRRPGYNERTVGFDVERARDIETRYGPMKRTVGGRVAHVSLDEESGVDPKEDFDVSYPVIAARMGFSQDESYPIVNPTEGFSRAGQVELGYADGPLIKFTGRGALHRQLTKKLTYHFLPSGGFMPFESDQVGITERFFLGGTDDLRGFEFRGAGRRDEDDDDVPIGGGAKLLVKNELTFPIHTNPDITGVLFADIGTLGKSPVSFETPRASVGTGVRLKMGQTTLGLDLAVPVLKKGGDQTQFLHFSFQSSF